MLFSRSSSQSSSDTASSSEASTSSSASSSASAPQVDAGEHLAEWQTKGAAGLGVISSLASECTPLKHRYDACFDLWFRDYLSIGDSQIVQQEKQRGASSAPLGLGKSRTPDSDIEARKKNIMERYDRDCGALFKDYQSCVKVSHLVCPCHRKIINALPPPHKQKAISDRDLDGLITQARKENPFPFDHERRSNPRENNPPFPFPAARD